MLIVALILLPWLALLCLILALCRAAARGDEALLEVVRDSQRHAFLPRLVVSRDAPELAARDIRTPSASPSHRLPSPAAR